MTMVIAQHCGLLPFGWVGVWMFYVISGFVITRGFLGSTDTTLPVRTQFGNFVLRRFFRIVPVYLVYILVNVVVLLNISGTRQFGDLPYLLTFTYNWHMIFDFWPGSSQWGPFGHLWTLSVEEQFYLIFPFIALVLLPRLRLPVTVALIVAGPILRYLFSSAMAGYTADIGLRAFGVYAASICHFDAFLLGSLVARLEPAFRTSPRYATVLWAAAITLTAGYAVSYVLINQGLGAVGMAAYRNVISGILYGQGREVLVYAVVDLFACALLVHALLQRPFTRILASPAMAFVGRVSYGGYLFHTLILWFVGELFQGSVRTLPVGTRLICLAMVWTVTVLLASLSFRWLETPIASWGRRFQGR